MDVLGHIKEEHSSLKKKNKLINLAVKEGGNYHG